MDIGWPYGPVVQVFCRIFRPITFILNIFVVQDKNVRKQRMVNHIHGREGYQNKSVGRMSVGSPLTLDGK
jgi:hypothetical protein